MSRGHTLRLTTEARADVLRLHTHLSNADLATAKRALDVLGRAFDHLEQVPMSCRLAEMPDGGQPHAHANPASLMLRECLIRSGPSGYVALFQIEPGGVVTVLAVRAQRDDDLR